MPHLTLAAGILGFLAVALGVFGAHGLEDRLSAAATGWWETATFYALTHAVAAIAIALSERKTLRTAGWAFVTGAVLFAGSLYALALGALSAVGAVTPLGGLAFLAGWAILIGNGLRR